MKFWGDRKARLDAEALSRQPAVTNDVVSRQSAVITQHVGNDSTNNGLPEVSTSPALTRKAQKDDLNQGNTSASNINKNNHDLEIEDYDSDMSIDWV